VHLKSSGGDRIAHGHHPEIRVIKEYGNLPKVECYAGQLNQVFMNLLTNAIDALEELWDGRPTRRRKWCKI
jgi:signal transduction histidine kinase